MNKVMGFVFSMMLFLSASGVHAEVNTGAPAPDFKLTDINGTPVSLSDYKGKFVVLEWFNYDCPFVVKHYSGGNMQGLQKEYTDKGVVWLSINSSATGKEGNYSAADTLQMAKERNMASSAVLLDSDGVVGKQYGAKTTPHMFVINPEGAVIYQGAIDNVPSADAGDIAGAKNYVRMALDESLAGKSVTEQTTKSYGCSVKY